MYSFFDNNIIQRLENSNRRAHEIHDQLVSRTEDLTFITIREVTRGAWNFHVQFKKNPAFKLSISIPMDMLVGFCETALILNTNLHYNAKWGYEDVRRMKDFDDLMNEIQRIYHLILSEQGQSTENASP